MGKTFQILKLISSTKMDPKFMFQIWLLLYWGVGKTFKVMIIDWKIEGVDFNFIYNLLHSICLDFLYNFCSWIYYILFVW
jgi:hypothetical protein